MKNQLMKIFKKQYQLILNSLKYWHVIIAVVSLIQVILLIIFSRAYNLPVTILFSTQDYLATKLSGKPVMAPGAHELIALNIVDLVAVLFLVLIIYHLLQAKFYGLQYGSELKQKVNESRWIFFAVNGGLMLIVISLLVGVYDLASLVLVFSLVLIFSSTGLILEKNNFKFKQNNQILHLISWISGFAVILPWLIISLYVFTSNVFANGEPLFVYLAFLAGLLFFGLMIANLLLIKHQLLWRKNPKKYIYGELFYMILNTVVISAFAWVVFIGILQT